MNSIYLAIGAIDAVLIALAMLAWFRKSHHPEQQVRARRLFSVYVFCITLFYTQLFIAKYDPSLYRVTFYGLGPLFAIAATTIRYLFIWSVVHFRPIPLRIVLWTLLPFVPALIDILYPIMEVVWGNHEPIPDGTGNHYWGHTVLHFNAAPPMWSVLMLFGPIFYLMIMQTRLVGRFLRFGQGDHYYFTKRIYLSTIHAFSLAIVILAFLMVYQVGARDGFWDGLLPASANEGLLLFGIRFVSISHVVVVALFMAVPKLVQFQPIDPVAIRERIQRSFRRKSSRDDAESGEETNEHSIITEIRVREIFIRADLRVDQLATELGVSTDELRRIFLDEVGLNFNQILNALRVEHLLLLIERGGLQRYTLEALGNQSGFNSRTTMYRALRRFAPEYAIQI